MRRLVVYYILLSHPITHYKYIVVCFIILYYLTVTHYIALTSPVNPMNILTMLHMVSRNHLGTRQQFAPLQVHQRVGAQ